MKRLMLAPLVVGITFVGVVAAIQGHKAVADSTDQDIVGVWEVDAAAPYRPHLFTFHSDGTMVSANPTDVQESSTAPHGGTNDSLGQGVWKVENDNGTHYVVGTFEELNAFADNHQPTDTLSVSFKVQLTDNGDGFDGPASAKIAGDTFPSHLTGVRVHIDTAAVNTL